MGEDGGLGGGGDMGGHLHIYFKRYVYLNSTEAAERKICDSS